MTLDDVMAELERLGSPTQKKTLMRHGAKEPFFGVKIGDMKVLHKKIKTDHALALALYDTGNSDAMYFAGYICDPNQMTKAQLKKWVKQAYWHMLSQYTVAWVAAESPHAVALALEWIESKSEQVAAAGWSTYASYVSITPDEDLNLDEIVGLLERIPQEIGKAKNRVKYSMNNFVIAVGAAVAPLTAKAKAIAKTLGQVEVDLGDTACEVPVALAYIQKIESMGKVGNKRKSAMC